MAGTALRRLATVAGLAIVGGLAYFALERGAIPRENEATRRETLDLDHVPVKGKALAPLQVVQYSDFLCAGCRATANELSRLIPLAGERMAVHFKNYPLDAACNPAVSRSVHPGACDLALAGICAHEQGRFWTYHDRVFAAPPPNPRADGWRSLGVELGLDAAAWQSCMGSDRAKRRLAAEISEAARVRVVATPTLFINGKRLAHLRGFYDAVETEARRLGVPSLFTPP